MKYHGRDRLVLRAITVFGTCMCDRRIGRVVTIGGVPPRWWLLTVQAGKQQDYSGIQELPWLSSRPSLYFGPL